MHLEGLANWCPIFSVFNSLFAERNYIVEKARYHFCVRDNTAHGMKYLMHEKQNIFDPYAGFTFWQEFNINSMDAVLSCPRKGMDNILNCYREFLCKFESKNKDKNS